MAKERKWYGDKNKKADKPDDKKGDAGKGEGGKEETKADNVPDRHKREREEMLARQQKERDDMFTRHAGEVGTMGDRHTQEMTPAEQAEQARVDKAFAEVGAKPAPEGE
jgi:hypothetical protein